MSGRYAIFHICVGVEGGVEFGGNESEEEVQKVDAESVGDCGEGSMARNECYASCGLHHTNVPALCEDYPHGEEQEHDARGYPSVGDVGRRLVQVGLVDLCNIASGPMRHQYCLRLASQCCCQCHCHTCWKRVVCAETAAKGVSGSGASMVAAVDSRLDGGEWAWEVEEEEAEAEVKSRRAWELKNY